MHDNERDVSYGKECERKIGERRIGVLSRKRSFKSSPISKEDP